MTPASNIKNTEKNLERQSTSSTHNYNQSNTTVIMEKQVNTHRI